MLKVVVGYGGNSAPALGRHCGLLRYRLALLSQRREKTMQVELISKGCIRPSSPTPPKHRTHKLSLLDQLATAAHIPIVFIYPFAQGTTNNELLPRATVDSVLSLRSLLLKQSLSQTLTRFYPLAGTIRDEVSIECNDEGTYYAEARVDSPLSDHLHQLDQTQLTKFLPLVFPSLDVPSGAHSVLIQQTNFACGGMVICAMISHMAADGTAFGAFLKAWARTARGLETDGCDHLFPNYDANEEIFHSHYKQALPRELNIVTTCSPMARIGVLTSRTFVFDAAAISRLKEQLRRECLENPSRVEVVTALLWRRMKAVFRSRSGVDRPLGIALAVNMRQRAGHHLFPQYSPGNFAWLATPVCRSDDPDLGSLVTQLKQAIGKIDGEFVTSLIEDEALASITTKVKEMQDDFSSSDYVMVTSMCNSGLYEVDFGWGKPVKAGFVGPSRSEHVTPFSNLVMIADTRTENGAEAMVIVDEEEMALLEHDQELLSYAQVDPVVPLPC